MNNFFTDTLKEQARKLQDPMHNVNKAMLGNLERITEFSLTTARNYADLGLKQLQVITSIKDPDSLTAFQSSQAQLLTQLNQMVLKDAERLNELGNQLRNDLGQLMGDVYQKATQPAAAAEEAAKSQVDKAGKASVKS